MTQPGFSEQNNIVHITSLSPYDRERYGTIVYALDTPSRSYLASALAAMNALKSHEADQVPDLMEDADGRKTLVIRSGTTDKKDQQKEAALFAGLASAIRHSLELSVPPADRDTKERVVPVAMAKGKELLDDFYSDNKVSEAVLDYYSGLRWGTDQDRLVRALIERGADYAEKLLDACLNPHFLSRHLMLHVDHTEYREILEMKLDALFGRFPKIDYRQLRSEEFAASQAGKRLKSFYAGVCGEILYAQYQRAEMVIDADGNLIPKTLIPLSRYPVVEALMCEEIVANDPRSYSWVGPKKPIGIILDSDSVRAHAVLVDFLISPLSARKCNLYTEEGNEFIDRSPIVMDLCLTYRNAMRSSEGRQLLKNDLISILNAYTDSQFSAHLEPEDGRVSKGKDCVRSILEYGIISPDPELSQCCADKVLSFLTSAGEHVGAFALERSDIQRLLIDSLTHMGPDTDADLIGKLAHAAFQSQKAGELFQNLVQLHQKADTIFFSPIVLQVLNRRREAHFSAMIDGDNPEKDNADREYDRITLDAKALIHELDEKKNAFLISLVRNIIHDQQDAVMRLEDVLHRLRFAHYFADYVPESYFELIRLAEDP